MQPHIKHDLKNGIGTIYLNRPHAFNALNLPMIQELHKILKNWELDENVKEVLIKAHGEKAFCAGGDIKQVFLAKKEGNLQEAGSLYFQTEYELNYRVAVYKKPLTVMAHGYCLGGGMGLFQYASSRLVDKSVKLGMPEGSIGFFTDVGASYFLPKLPGNLGLFVALTGYMVDYEDAFFCGFSTHETGTKGYLKTHQEEIDKLFSFDTVDEIIRVLAKSNHPKAHKWLSQMKKQSPLSLKVIDRYLRLSKLWDLKTCLQQDFILAQNMIHLPDFEEGVRAQVVDKDKNPKWKHKNTDEISEDFLDSLFKAPTSTVLNLDEL